MDDEDDDIFQMLLKNEGGKQTRKTEVKNDDDDGLPFGLNFSIDPTISCPPPTTAESESLIFESIYSHGWTILDLCKDDSFLYVLIDNGDNSSVVQVYLLDGCDKLQKPKMLSVLPTAVKSSSFKDTERPDVRHLYIVHQDDSCIAPAPSSASINPGNILLPTSAFASIFGKPTALAKSPVLLLCAEDGLVFWRPCKSLGGDGRFRLLCQLHSVVTSIVCVSLCKKSDVDEDVANTLTNALALEGETGSGMIGLLAVCAIGSSVEAVSLNIRGAGKLTSISLNNCVTLKKANISRLLYCASQGDSEPQLMGLTSELDMVPIPMTSSHASHAVSTTHQIRDTVQRINHHSAAIKALGETSTVLDAHLLQLNLFATLHHQQHQPEKSSEGTRPMTSIHCECYCDHSQGYRKGSEVRIELRNDSKVNLSDQWSVLVTVTPESPLVNSVNSKPCANTFCFRLGVEFKSGSRKTFSVPLPECITSDPMAQLRVAVSLIFSLNQVGSLSLPPTKDGPCKVLEVEIYYQILNCLHFLRVSSEEDLSVSQVCRKYSNEELRTSLDSLMERRLKDKKRQKKVDHSPKQNIELKMYVPDLVDQDSSRTEPKEEIVRMLFHNIRHFSDDKSLLLCQSPTGTEIRFNLQSRMESSPTNSRAQERLQLKIESTDIILLSTVHFALLERFKELTKDGTGKDKTMTKKDLDEQLIALKSIRPYLSNGRSSTRRDELISNLCRSLDCLGKLCQ